MPSEGPTGLGAGRDRAVPAYERLQERSRRFVESAATSEALSYLAGARRRAAGLHGSLESGTCPFPSFLRAPYMKVARSPVTAGSSQRDPV